MNMKKTFLHGNLDEKIYMEHSVSFSYFCDRCCCRQNNFQKVVQGN